MYYSLGHINKSNRFFINVSVSKNDLAATDTQEFMKFDYSIKHTGLY